MSLELLILPLTHFHLVNTKPLRAYKIIKIKKKKKEEDRNREENEYNEKKKKERGRQKAILRYLYSPLTIRAPGPEADP